VMSERPKPQCLHIIRVSHSDEVHSRGGRAGTSDPIVTRSSSPSKQLTRSSHARGHHLRHCASLAIVHMRGNLREDALRSMVANRISLHRLPVALRRPDQPQTSRASNVASTSGGHIDFESVSALRPDNQYFEPSSTHNSSLHRERPGRRRRHQIMILAMSLSPVGENHSVFRAALRRNATRHLLLILA
jgi:hypothetical protein